MNIALTFLFAALASAPQAIEEPSPRPFRHAIRGDMGLFSALGFSGASYSIEPAGKPVMLELGMGIGYSGAQLSVMPKLVLGSRAHRFTTGVGVSVGIPGLKVVGGPPGTVLGRRLTPWLNADIAGYDYRSDSGFTLAAAAGLTLPLMNGCVEGIDSCVNLHGLVLPQFRVGFGRWF